MRKMINRLLIIFIAGLSLFGCKPCKVAQQETVIKDSLYITQHMIDRVLIRDSVYERQVHDTIYRYRERETVRYLSLRDTMYIERRDSVTVPYPVERELTKWQSFRLSVGGYAIVACVILLTIFAIRLIKRFKR